MSVKAYDVNSDYVFVAWKPPNTVNEAPIVGYFVDRLVHASFSRKYQLSVLMMSSQLGCYANNEVISVMS